MQAMYELDIDTLGTDNDPTLLPIMETENRSKITQILCVHLNESVVRFENEYRIW